MAAIFNVSGNQHGVDCACQPRTWIPSGNKAKGWSCFPITLAMTATWDPKLISRVGRAIALEQAFRGRLRSNRLPL